MANIFCKSILFHFFLFLFSPEFSLETLTWPSHTDHTIHSDLIFKATADSLFIWSLREASTKKRKCNDCLHDAWTGMSQCSAGLKGEGKGWWRSPSNVCGLFFYSVFFKAYSHIYYLIQIILVMCIQRQAFAVNMVVEESF